MDTTQFLANIAEQYEDTDESAFTMETEFKKLKEWSSLVALSIIAMVDEEYDVPLKDVDIRSCTTIQDLINLVAAKR